MPGSIEFTIQLPVYPERVFRAWLDSAEHSRFTGKPAVIDDSAGGDFRTLDGQVSGKTLVKTPYDHLVQIWKMNHPTLGNWESSVELTLEPTCTGTELKLRQTGVPDQKTREVLKWWEVTYLRPLSNYFSELVGDYVADMGDG